MPKDKKKAKGVLKHSPLEQVMLEGNNQTVEKLNSKKMGGIGGGGRKFGHFKDDDEDDDDDDNDNDYDADEQGDGNAVGAGGSANFIPAKLSKRILEAAREQQLEAEEEPDVEAAAMSKKKGGRHVQFGGRSSSGGALGAGAPGGKLSGTAAKRRGPRDGSGNNNNEDDDDDDEDDNGDNEVIEFDDDEGVVRQGDYVQLSMGDEEMSAAEAAALARFMPSDGGARRSLADIIMAKLAEKEAEDEGGAAFGGSGSGASSSAPRVPGEGLDPKVIEVYTDVGKYLATYRSGKLPRVLKVAPSLSAWEDVTFLTNPETWTPHATYAVTRIFASNFNPAKAQRFYNAVLLPKCRDDIYMHKKLNFHLYLALKKSVYKPAAFYKGIILPLAAGGDCTLREAVIFASVLSKASIPQLHSAAAIMKLASMPYTGAVSIFLRALINKKYTLPYMAVDSVVDHFLMFMEDDGPLPLLWHQSLLALAQRYKADLTAEQKEGIRALLIKHTHYAITPEVRRELASAGCRGDPVSMVPNNSSSTSSTTASGGGAAGTRETGGSNLYRGRRERGSNNNSSSSSNSSSKQQALRPRSGDDLDED